MMRTLRWIVCAAAVGLPCAAGAQSKPPFDLAIDIQTFEYAIGPKTFVTVADGDVARRGLVAFDALVTLMTKRFEVLNVDPTTHMLSGTRTTVAPARIGGLVRERGVADAPACAAAKPADGPAGEIELAAPAGSKR